MRASLVVAWCEHNAPSAFGADRCIGPAPNSRACPQSLDVRVSQNQIVCRYQCEVVQTCGGDKYSIYGVFVKLARQFVRFSCNVRGNIQRLGAERPDGVRDPCRSRFSQLDAMQNNEPGDFQCRHCTDK